MVQASSAYSRQHAVRLSELKNSLVVKKNMSAVHIIGINARGWSSELMAAELARNVKFEIYKSSRDNDHWSRLGTLKDDVLVYDRCGNLAFYLPFPHSYLPYRYVEGAILAAYSDSPCGTCQLQRLAPNCSQSEQDSAVAVGRQSVYLECANVDLSNCSVRHRTHQSFSPAERLIARCCRLHRHRSPAHQRCRCLPVGSEQSCVCSRGLPTESS